MARNHALSRAAFSAAALFSVVGLAAQSVQPRPAPAPPRGEQPPLRGPTVEDNGIPGTARAFTMEESMSGPQQRMLNREIPMNEFMAALRGLNAPETPDDLHLTPDQRAELGTIAREHARAMSDHMAAHRDELLELGQTLGFDAAELLRGERAMAEGLGARERQMRQRAAGQPRPAGEDGTPRPGGARRAQASVSEDAGAAPRADAPMSPEQRIRSRVGDNPTPQQREALGRLREIRAGAPGGLEAQTRAWHVLSEPQQQFVQARLDQSRAEMDARRGEMYVEMMTGREQPGRPEGPRSASGSAAARLHQLIDTLSPQEQEMLLRTIETRLQQRRGGGQPAGPGRRPPPPAMDEVNVPPAEPV